MSARAMQEALKALSAKKADSASLNALREQRVTPTVPVVTKVDRTPRAEEKPRRAVGRIPKALPSSNEQHGVCGFQWDATIPTSWGAQAKLGMTCHKKPGHLGDHEDESGRFTPRLRAQA